MIDLTEVKSGVIEDLFTKTELSNVVELMSKLDSGDDRIKHNSLSLDQLVLVICCIHGFLKRFTIE